MNNASQADIQRMLAVLQAQMMQAGLNKYPEMMQCLQVYLQQIIDQNKKQQREREEQARRERERRAEEQRRKRQIEEANQRQKRRQEQDQAIQQLLTVIFVGGVEFI